MKVLVALIELVEDLKNLRLSKKYFFLEQLGKIASIIQLRNDIAIVSCHKRVDIPK